MKTSGIIAVLLVVLCSAFGARAQEEQPTTPAPATAALTINPNPNHESARSDKFTGGRIEHAAFMPNEPDIKITVEVPAFRLTLWQNGKEVKTYQIGVGRKDYPIMIGELAAREVIWNPSWIPPDSDWVDGMKTVKAGEVIPAGDSRNPLGKLKIPLGYGYLIHQAHEPTDLGNLVSHGCVRMLQSDLYDLAEKIVAARGTLISDAQIARAKTTTKTLAAALDPTLPVEVNYDTIVVEGGVLSIYPDVYERGTNTVENLDRELEENGVDASRLSNLTLQRMLRRANAKQKFSVKLSSVTRARTFLDGRNLPLVTRAQTTATGKDKPKT